MSAERQVAVVTGGASGIGLATVHGIIRQIGARLEVDSTPGHGTTFRILMPAWKEEALPPTEAVSEGSEP